ncbi:MAG TPA: hypothetical protein PLN48_17100 [Lachnospiraceae bacterium]|jgi:hypothetical protein|nr:hypothetical protein [Lachnospiraceae bacterium]
MMQRIKNYDKGYCLTDRIAVDKVYPLSILERRQHGELFVDNEDTPKTVLFWRYCGFAYIAGTPDEAFLSEIVSLMRNPGDGHSGRLVLHVGRKQLASDSVLIGAGVKKEERYQFRFTGGTQQFAKLRDGFDIRRIDAFNYSGISGRIVPGFSWKNESDR